MPAAESETWHTLMEVWLAVKETPGSWWLMIAALAAIFTACWMDRND